MDLVDFKTTFDGILEKYVDEKIAQAKQLLVDPKLNKFVGYIDTFIFSGGKRIRPYCLWAIYMWLGGKQEKDVLQFGIIFELLHSMALIHDDIIDESKKRHNAPTVHCFVESLLEEWEKRHHVAEWQAILIGDLLLSRVYELWYKMHGFPNELLDEARINIHSMVEEVILGQMIDVDMMISGPATLEMIDKKNMYKTASYTFIRPMLTWAILAGVSSEQKKLISEFGKHLGLAFQVKDDMMDLTLGDKTKSVFKDIQEGQQTYFTNYIFNKGTWDQKQLLSECLGKSLNEEQIKKLQEMFESSGAIDFGKEMINDFISKAKWIFDQIDFSDEKIKQGLGNLMKKIEHF